MAGLANNNAETATKIANMKDSRPAPIITTIGTNITPTIITKTTK